MRHTGDMLESLAVIVPVGPGDGAWRGLLPQLTWLPASAQLRLVCCREDDRAWAELERAPGLPEDRGWLLAPRGRACQLNAGAAATQARFLWFVHADSRFLQPRSAAAALQRALAAYPDALGYFDLRFLGDGPAATTVNTLGAWIRSHWLRLPFGDQGLFLSRENFARLGGFDESLAVAEDHALVWAARRAGIRVRAAGASIHTSARRYAEHGWLRTTASHLRLTWRQARTFSRPRGDRR
jgi:hypothetical protein